MEIKYLGYELSKRVKKMWDKAPPEAQAVLLSFILSVLRIVYDDKEAKPVRIVIESLICGFLTLAVFHAIQALGLDINWAVCAGGVIGFFGVNAVRALALKFVNKRI